MTLARRDPKTLLVTNEQRNVFFSEALVIRNDKTLYYVPGITELMRVGLSLKAILAFRFPRGLSSALREVSPRRSPGPKHLPRVVRTNGTGTKSPYRSNTDVSPPRSSHIFRVKAPVRNLMNSNWVLLFKRCSIHDGRIIGGICSEWRVRVFVADMSDRKARSTVINRTDINDSERRPPCIRDASLETRE